MPPTDTMTDFTRRTLAHIRLGGWPVVARKLKSVLLRFALPMVAVLCAPLLAVLRPVLWVRFGMIYGTRIGHMSYRLAYYLAERELGVQPRRAIDIFFIKGLPANQTVAQLIRCKLVTTDLAQPFFRIYSRLSWMNDHIVRIRQTEHNRDRDLDGVLARTAPHVRLSPDTEIAGRQALSQHGIPDAAHWVCFLARDPAYLRDGLASGIDDKWREQEAARPQEHGRANLPARDGGFGRPRYSFVPHGRCRRAAAAISQPADH